MISVEKEILKKYDNFINDNREELYTSFCTFGINLNKKQLFDIIFKKNIVPKFNKDGTVLIQNYCENDTVFNFDVDICYEKSKYYEDEDKEEITLFDEKENLKCNFLVGDDYSFKIINGFYPTNTF